MGKRKRARKLAKAIASGQTLFECRQCSAVFARERDRQHHEKDAHGPGAKAKARGRSSRAVVVHRHANTNTGVSRVPYHSPKNDQQLFVIDYISPHSRIICAASGCAEQAIPLTGLCIEHDPVCSAITTSRMTAAIAKAEKAAQAARDAAAAAKKEAEDSTQSSGDFLPGAHAPKAGDNGRLVMDDWYGGYGGYH